MDPKRGCSCQPREEGGNPIKGWDELRFKSSCKCQYPYNYLFWVHRHFNNINVMVLRTCRYSGPCVRVMSLQIQIESYLTVPPSSFQAALAVMCLAAMNARAERDRRGL